MRADMRADATPPQADSDSPMANNTPATASSTEERHLAEVLPLQSRETPPELVEPADTPAHASADTPAEASVETGPVEPSLDIGSAVEGWSHDPDRVCVRLIRGDDGLPKLQMRLDLGVLQMETAGRPDGQRPRGNVSLLAYHEARLVEYVHHEVVEAGFVLSPRDCQQIQQEAAMYSRRLLSWFVLGEWELAAADAKHVLAAMAFVGDYATEERDRSSMGGWKPYIIMMHARARAAMLMNDEQGSTAVRVVESALRNLGRHYRQFGGKQAYATSAEIRTLKTLLRKLHKRIPRSPIKQMKRELRRAIQSENFERAAELRDQLARL